MRQPQGYGTFDRDDLVVHYVGGLCVVYSFCYIEILLHLSSTLHNLIYTYSCNQHLTHLPKTPGTETRVHLVCGH